MGQNLLSASLYFISSSLEAAVYNMIPVFTYILTIISRQEKFGINTIWGKGKLIGTLISVSGALTLMLWQSSAISLLSTTSFGDRVLGLVMVVVGVLALTTWLLLLVSYLHLFYFLGCLVQVMVLFKFLSRSTYSLDVPFLFGNV